MQLSWLHGHCLCMMLRLASDEIYSSMQTLLPNGGSYRRLLEPFYTQDELAAAANRGASSALHVAHAGVGNVLSCTYHAFGTGKKRMPTMNCASLGECQSWHRAPCVTHPVMQVLTSMVLHTQKVFDFHAEASTQCMLLLEMTVLISQPTRRHRL